MPLSTVPRKQDSTENPHVVKFEGPPASAAKRASELVNQTREEDGTYDAFASTGPTSERVETSFYQDRPLMDRARKAETMEFARLFEDHNILYDEPHSRDGHIGAGWTPWRRSDMALPTNERPRTSTKTRPQR